MVNGTEKITDCLHRVRYRYTLSEAANETLLRQYADEETFKVSVYDARHLLPLSRVTFQIEPRDGSFLINGALGLRYVSITYVRNERLDVTRAAQEEVLARLS
jgi:hypothetical protein